MGKGILRALALKTAVSGRPTISCKVSTSTSAKARRRCVSLVGGSSSGLECKWRSLFKGFVDLLGDLDFLLVPHHLKEEMLKGRVVEEGSGLSQNDSESVGSSVAFIPGNVDQVLESGQSGLRVKGSRRAG